MRGGVAQARTRVEQRCDAGLEAAAVILKAAEHCFGPLLVVLDDLVNVTEVLAVVLVPRRRPVHLVVPHNPVKHLRPHRATSELGFFEIVAQTTYECEAM